MNFYLLGAGSKESQVEATGYGGEQPTGTGIKKSKDRDQTALLKYPCE